MKRYELRLHTEDSEWLVVENNSELSMAKKAFTEWSQYYKDRKYRLVEIVEVETVIDGDAE